MTADEIQAALCEPFAPNVIGWKPQSAKGERALAVAYIDARDVMDRLDSSVGVGGWEDEYHQLGDGNVMCRLTVHLPDGRRVVKSDVGGPSEQPDGGDRLKAAFSDAMKRAAVKFGIGRYLYSLPAVWCDYDPQKKQFRATPQLPAWAVPKAKGKPAPAHQPAASPAPDRADQYLDAIRKAVSVDELKAVYEAIPADVRGKYNGETTRRKQALTAATQPA